MIDDYGNTGAVAGVPPIDIAAAVANLRLRDEQSIMVQVGALRELVALAEQAQRPPADDLDDQPAEHWMQKSMEAEDKCADLQTENDILRAALAAAEQERDRAAVLLGDEIIKGAREVQRAQAAEQRAQKAQP